MRTPNINTQEFNLTSDNKLNAKAYTILTATFLILGLGVFSAYHFQPDYEQFQADRIKSSWGFPFLVTATALFVFKISMFLYHVVLFLRYKATASVQNDELPICTVIVPAYNEGKLVYDTLKSLVESDYPTEKLQLLAIDDGSKDDTWSWIEKAREDFGPKITIFKQPINKGKREALYKGFQIGIGEVFVTVDSDSIVKSDTLRNLVSPLVTDLQCGAVAGNVAVLNNNTAILPKMLNVSFVMSFEFKRSAESVLGSVMCTPGALAAYRREAVFQCLEEWINQTFMGNPSDIGEDRAMTNMILKQGYKVLFQKNAYVLTNVPEDYSGLNKMFIRWGRSNVRENLMMSKYVFKDFRKESKIGTRLMFLDQSTNIVMAYPFMLFMFYFIISHPLLFLSTTLFTIAVASTFSFLFYAKKHSISESFWAYSYSLFYTFSLFWITPYAIATAHKRGWLTRGLK